MSTAKVFEPSSPGAADSSLGAEVPATLASGLIGALRKRGCSDREIEGIAPGLLEQLNDGAITVSWTDYRNLFSRVGELYSDSQLDGFGSGFTSSRAGTSYALVSRLIRDRDDFVRWLRGPMRRMGITCIEQELIVSTPDHLRLETSMRSGYEASREYFIVRFGFLRGIVQEIGGRGATIEVKIDGDRATYDIRMAARRSWKRRLGNFLRRHRADSRTLQAGYEVMQTMREETQERSVALEKSREQLRQSERLASIGTLAAGIAHEINNPVGMVQLSAEYALSSSADENREAIREEALRTCLAESKRAGEIVRNVLSFAGASSAERARVDLCEVVIRSERLVSAYKRGVDSKVTVDTGDEPLFVLCSDLEFEQVFVNVIRNAIESCEGGASVKVRCRALGDLARIEVLDDGDGIETEDLPHLFDPFFSTRKNKGGTGLGLSVAHGIVTAHQGRIWAESEMDKGTRVVIEMALLRSAE